VLADPRVVRARVTIEKPEAFADAASVGVVVERTRVEESALDSR
jgi:dihydroneopterin aldolase